MLKIKDDVDLKELEKFEFEKFETYDYFKRVIPNRFMYGYSPAGSKLAIITYTDNRTLYISTQCLNQEEMFDVIFDLIQAGLVEKV